MKYTRGSSSVAGLAGCLVMLVVIVGYLVIGTLCNVYVSEYWLTYFSKKDVFIHVPTKWCAVASIIGVASAPIAIVTKIVSYSIDNPLYDQCHDNKNPCHYANDEE